ncbi:hypothetical protein NC651_019372 [Populus alba x Populus x berolinensis]|nr:hypothetical protein NC651_019372 [Populus alba x Populus x berolinensis]
MEEGHHDLSKVTVAGDPQLLQNKVNAVRLAGPAKLQDDAPMRAVAKLVSQMCSTVN